MSSLLPLIAAVLLSASPDPIGKMVSDLSANPVWKNGQYNPIKLPETTPAEDLVSVFMKERARTNATTATYQILEVRHVHIRGDLPDLYTAVLLKTDDGEKILLLQHTQLGWWPQLRKVD